MVGVLRATTIALFLYELAGIHFFGDTISGTMSQEEEIVSATDSSSSYVVPLTSNSSVRYYVHILRYLKSQTSKCPL